MYISEFYTRYLQLFNPKLKFANECQMNNISLNWTIPKIGIVDTLLLKRAFGLLWPFSYISAEKHLSLLLNDLFWLGQVILTEWTVFSPHQLLEEAGVSCCLGERRKIRCKYTQIAFALRNGLLRRTGKIPHNCTVSVFMKAVISFSFFTFSDC